MLGPPSQTAGRLVWSEADFLPGLVVDRYGEVLAVQCQTLGMARVRHVLVAALRTLLGERPILTPTKPRPRPWRDSPRRAGGSIDPALTISSSTRDPCGCVSRW